MMTMKMISRMAPALALLAASAAATTLNADTIDRDGPRALAFEAEDGATVSIMNNHGYQVVVYLVDSSDRRHLLGTVDDEEFKSLTVPAHLSSGTEAVRIKIYPVLPRPGLDLGLGLFGENENAVAVKTAPFALRPDHVIQLFLEPNLTRSRIGIASS